MESNDQNQIAKSYTELLGQLISESGNDSLESWCIACITFTDIPNSLYHAMFFHGQLKRYKESKHAHVLKNPHDRRIPSELEIEKISFLESLNDERLGLLDNPPDSISVLQELIDITKQELKSSSGQQRVQINERLLNLELIWQIQQCIQASKDKLQQIILSEQQGAQSRLEQVLLEIKNLRDQWLAGDNDDIKENVMKGYIEDLETEKVQKQSKPIQLKKITEKLNLITAIHNKIKERDFLLQNIGPKKSFSEHELISKIQNLEEKIQQAMLQDELQNIKQVDVYLKTKQEEEKKLATKPKKLQECQEKIQELRQIISDEKQLQILKRELMLSNLKYMDLDEKTFAKVTQSQSQLASREATMRQYLDMPNCLEYSLYKIAYFTEVLKSKAQDTIFTESDIEESIILIINALEKQYKDEAQPKHYNEKKDQLINLTQVRDAKGGLNLEEIQKAATELLTSIKKFDFEEFFHLHSLVDEVAKEIRDKDIVLLLGSTGSGKSTTTHYLCGSLLEKILAENKLEHIQAQKIICEDLLRVKISNASRSETRYITPIKINLNQIGSDKKQTVILVDSPGAEDTESYEVDIANMLGIIKAIHHAKTVRPIILVSFMKQGCRSEGMAGVLQFYCHMINDVQKNGDKFHFVFTKADDDFNLEDLQALVLEIQDKYCNKVGNQEFDSFIDHLVLKTAKAVNQESPQQVRILRPLDRDYIKFHEDILESEPIKDPSKVFQKTVLPKAYESVDQQFRLSSQGTLQALKNKNDKLAFYKFNQLIKYAAIFPKNESYERQLKNLIQEITGLLNRAFEQGVEKINNVFEKGNKLTKDVLTQFFKAYQDFKNLDEFVFSSRARVADETNLMHPDQVKSIKEDWKTSNLFITNLIRICSFSFFIEKNKEIEIDSPRWEEYISRINLISDFLEFDRNGQFKGNLEFMSQQIIEAEKAFKQSMNTLSNEIVLIIASNIVLQPENAGEDNQIDFAIKRMKVALEKIMTSQELCKDNEFLTIIISEGIQLIENCLIRSFNQILHRDLQELYELIQINKAQKEQNERMIENQVPANNFGEIQLINVSKEQAMNVTSFLKIHGQVIEQLQFYLNPEYFQKIKMIGQQFSDDLFDIYTVNEKKLSDVASNQKSKIFNIKKANQQILILRKIPFIEQRTNISYNQVISKINQLFSNQKQAIDEVMPELAQKMSQRDGRLINTIYKLKDALKTIIELKDISDDFKSTYDQIAAEVQKNIDMYIDSIEDEISSSESNFSNPDSIKSLEPLYKQIMQIGEVAQVIGYKIKVDQEKVNKTHKAQLEKIKNFITPKPQQNEELKQSEQISIHVKFLKRQECEHLQKMHLYLKQFKDSTYLLKYTGLREEVQSYNLQLASFIEKQIEDMIQNIKDNIQKITDKVKESSKIKLQESDLEELQDQIGNDVQFIIYEIQDRLRTLKLIEKEKYYGMKEFLNITDQEEKVKEFVDDIFNKSFSLAQPKFDIKMIILRKLTILDSLLYPQDKKITEKYSLFDKTSISNPDDELEKATEELKDSKYNQLRDTLIEQRDGIVISKIQYRLRQKEKEKIEKIKRVTAQMSEGFNERDLDEVNKSVEEILLIQQSIPQKFLAYNNKSALSIILEFYNSLIKVEENNKSQESFMNEFENIDQYYKMKISRPKYLETVTIQQSRIMSICPDEKLFKAQYEELQQALFQIEQFKKDFKQTFSQNRDPIQKIIEKLQKKITDSFDNFPKFKKYIDKLDQLQSQEIQPNDKKQAQKAKDQIQKMIDDCYKSQYERMKEDLELGILRETEFEKRINDIKNNYQYVSVETKLIQEKNFNEIFQEFTKKKMDSIEEFKNALQQNGINPLKLDFQSLPEKLQSQIFVYDADLVDEKCQQALQSALNMLKGNFCGVLKDHYPNLYSIKKIIHILSKEDGDTSKLMDKMDSYIAKNFDINLKEISEICQKFLQVEIINKQVEDQNLAAHIKIVREQLMCHLQFKIDHESISKVLIKELDKLMINCMEFLINIFKKITKKFEEIISEQNKLSDLCEIIKFVNTKNYILEFFNDTTFKRYIQLFLPKNETATQFQIIIDKLSVDNLVKQINELHLQPAINSIKESISKFQEIPTAQECLDQFPVELLSSKDKISELKEKRLLNIQVQDLLSKDCLSSVEKIPELFKKAVISQEELDLVQYKFTIIQNALSIQTIRKIESFEQFEELKLVFSNLWLNKAKTVELKASNVQKCLDNILNFQNEYQFILNLSNSIKINKINPEDVPQERKKIQKQIDNCEQSILSLFKIFIGNKENELQTVSPKQISNAAQKIISLQQLCELFSYNGPLNDESKLLINTTLEKISKHGTLAVNQIQDELQKIGKYGELIIISASIFQGMANEKINERLQKKTFSEILRGTSSNIPKQQEEIKQGENVNSEFLQRQYSKFKEEYDKIIKEGIEKGSYGEAEKKMADCKQIIQNLTKIEEKQRVGLDQLDSFGQLLANIFSIWTFRESQAYFNADKNLDMNRKKQLLKYPHHGQIIALFRMFCYQSYTKEPKMQHQLSEQRQNQFRLMNQKYFFNNIVEMQSSNGKSLVIAVASIIYALWGFEVYCCQKNDYLVKRNRAANEFLFTFLGVETKIKYNTIKTLCLSHIDEEQDLSIKESYCQRIVKQKQNFLKKGWKWLVGDKEKEIDTNTSRKTILLIQDVQVLFDKQIYGKIFEPKLNINEEEVIQLFDFIWEHHDRKFIVENGKISIEKEEKGKKKKEEFTKCSGIFHKQYSNLLEEAVKQIIFDLRQLQSVDKKIVDNKVLFKNDFKYRFTPDESYQNGYLTVWAYYQAYKDKQISEEIFKNKIALLIKCGKFSYHEILNQFGLITGVTSGLTTLNQQEEKYLQEKLSIQNFTIIPSIYEEKLINCEIKIAEQKSLFSEIKSAIDTALQKTQPVIVVFQDDYKLKEFFENFNQKSKINKITADIHNFETLQELILKAGEYEKITLISQQVAAGIDFQTSLENGIHVIQTFFSHKEIVDLQIRGLTARQGNKGSYEMILNQQDLEIRFGYDAELKKPKDELHSYLKELRQQKQLCRDAFDIEIIERLQSSHFESMKNLQRIKLISEIKAVSMYLQTLNKGSDINSEVHRTLILMEATQPMQQFNLNQILYKSFPLIQQELKHNIKQKVVHQFKIGLYRNYRCKDDKQIYQTTHKWTEKEQDILESFRNIKFESKSRMNKAAIEVALQETLIQVKELKNKQPIKTIIIIGKNGFYNYKNFEHITQWPKETSKYKLRMVDTFLDDLKKENVPICTFAFSEDKEVNENFMHIAKNGFKYQLTDPYHLQPLILEAIEGKYKK